MQVSQRHAMNTLLLVLASLSSFSEGFGIGPIRQGFLGSAVSDFAESVNGDLHLETIMAEVFSMNQTESIVSIDKDESISPVLPMAPPLTYKKFLTMQVGYETKLFLFILLSWCLQFRLICCFRSCPIAKESSCCNSIQF
jgi:hypothetical protein